MITQKNIAVSILLTIITCGIYGIYWFVTITNDLNSLSKREEISGGMAVIFSLITCGIYTLYWSYKCGQKVDAIRADRGESEQYSGIIYLVLALFGLQIVAYALIQDEINKSVQ